MTEIDACLSCDLLNCDESDPNCLFWMWKSKPQQKYHEKMKLDPEYCQRRHEAKKKWRKTEAGKESMRETARRYRAKKPEIVRAIGRRHHEKHKEKRLAQHREYKKRMRMKGGDSGGAATDKDDQVQEAGVRGADQSEI